MEFEIPAGKLANMRREKVVNTWMGWLEGEVGWRCWLIFQENMTPELLNAFSLAVEGAGSLDNFEKELKASPEFAQAEPRRLAIQQEFLTKLAVPDAPQEL